MSDKMRRRNFLYCIGAATVPGTRLPPACADESTAAAGQARNILGADGSTVSEQRREIPVTHEADVVVVGATVGGLGGCMAAVAAARQGARTLLIEESGHIDPHVPLGLGVVIGIKGWDPGMQEGLFREFAGYVSRAGQHARQLMTLEELLEKGELIIRYHEVINAAMLQMLQDAGVSMLFHTKCVDVVMAERKLQALIVESPQGRHAIRGKAFVDSTGLGDVAAAAGAPMLREEAFQGVQAYIAGVDEKRFNQWAEENNKGWTEAEFRAAMEKIVGPFDKLQYPWDQWWPEYLKRHSAGYTQRMLGAHAKGEIALLRRRGEKGILAIPEGIKVEGSVARPRTYITGLDPLNADDLSWCEVTSRLALMELLRFLKKQIPGFEECVMEQMADSISLRGGRYIEVKGGITPEQVERELKSPDAIFVMKKGPNSAAAEIPYNALLPDRVEGLLVVGKATAGGARLRTANAVLFQGQAAGTAAAMAARQGIAPRQIDIKELQQLLKSAGVKIPY